ncbi:stage VI sporulation protein D [Salinibacillus xinjiangensis]|uniref:stage VI sporulation protein D n=1 Tax=Salinibacillus xinjiangensis TaxID=1229268 RepID=UPI001890C818|nr:stage VI sporulation protein D [Salinibacillus xinjiangensis]
MNQDNRNVLNFELNELLWFQKGQELKELIGIALEPNITIQENDDFVSVRGVIELTGEYMPTVDSSSDDEHILSFQDRSAKNYISDVRSFEDGLNEFHYNIPVEITIPKYRVPSLDDVMVEIDYFDYEIPDTSQMKLQAQVAITGIQQEGITEEEPLEEERSEELAEGREDENQWEEVSEPFSFDVQFDEEAESASPSSSLFEDPSDVVGEEYKANDVEQEENSEDDKDRDLWFKKKSQTFEEFFKKDHDESQYEDDGSDSPYEDSLYEDTPYNESPAVEYNVDSYEESPSPESRENAIYLVNMFDREEDTYSKIRLCIVQESDTLESIAKRYEMPITHILRYNKLEDEEIQTGDILYIPVKKKQTDPS